MSKVAGEEEMLVGEYLFKRLREIGVETVFGVPGDYELPLLDLIPETNWNGSPNELIAAYSADGYSRVKGVGALITTFGPVVHIVGYPGVKAQYGGQILHHTLGDKKYDHYVKMSEQVSCAATVIMSAESAPTEIDRMLNAMFYYSQPVYIGIPVDIGITKISTGRLSIPIIKELPVPEDEIGFNEVVMEIIKRLKASKSTIIIADGGATRHKVIPEVYRLMDVLRCPTFTTLMGKGTINERHPQFCGVYGGASTNPNVKSAIESSDCVLWVGNYPSDFNTSGEFSEHVSVENTIDFQRFYVMIGTKKYNGTIKWVLQKVAKVLEDDSFTAKSTDMPTPYPPLKSPKSEDIKHEWLWQRFTSFLQPGDFVITETGCSQAGMAEAWLPENVGMFTQAIFGSIGFASGAAVGAAIAAKEIDIPYKRLILVTGDGSLQLTIQAFSILQRHGIIPIIFVLNNKGYTVERLIHGLNAAYNTIPDWDYCALFKGFGPEVNSKTYKVSSSAELDDLMKDEAFNHSKYPQLVDVIMDPFDCPVSVKLIGESADKHNAG